MGNMTAAEAAWVRKHAWTPAMRKTYASVPAVLAMCPCEYGPCGNCSAGQHENCPYDNPNNAQWAANRANVPAGWITTTNEQVPTLGGAESWQIWEAGIRHEGRCPCSIANHHGAIGIQTTIFDIIG